LQHGIATEGGAPPGSATFTPPPLAELAKLFPQLQILEIIGQGGMGAVYKARQPALDRFVALKILAPRSGGDLDFSGRFSREARALAKLSHPNIVAVYDFGQIQRTAEASSGTSPSTITTQSLSYFIMEFVDGPNLRQLEQAKKLTPREALQIIPQICGALQFAHDEGIVHRDIKPENVLIDKKGRVKIADFGLAKILGQEADFRLTGARDVMGTPHYMAPEQIEKPQEVDHRADIYSLGVVFYEMLTGELPLGKFDPPSHKVQIDVRLDDVVLRSLANNPDRRYQHVSEIKTQLESIAETPERQAAANHAAQSDPGVDYRSRATLFGLPLVHVVYGVDPKTGKARVAKGIIAIGGQAQGVVAIGGLAIGGLAIGGGAIGIVAFGGGALGVFSFGGLAIALVLALGGGAIAPIALGGGVLGYMALGGGGIGAHVSAANAHDPVAQQFFGTWGPALLKSMLFINTFVVFLAVGLGVGAPLFVRRYSNSSDTTNTLRPIKILVVTLAACMALLITVWIFLATKTHFNSAPLNSAATNLEAPLGHSVVTNPFAAEAIIAPKTIVLVRATNKWIDASNQTQTATLWTDSEMQPGEILSTLIKREDIGLRTNRAMNFVHQRSGKTTFSTSFTWFFGGTMGPAFGQTEAEAAIAQLNKNFTDRPTTLTPGNPKELFSVTNSSGEVMTGYIEFDRILPAPMKLGAKPEAIIHIRHFTSMPSSPAIDYAAKVPPGYALRAISKTGEGDTFGPAGPYEYHSSWMNLPEPIRPRRSEPGQIRAPSPPLPPRINSVGEWETQRKMLEDQFQELQDQGPVSVVLGEPKQIFAITNGAGEVFQGFLELVGPEPDGKARISAPAAEPAPTGKTQKDISNTNAQAVVHIRHFVALTYSGASVQYSAEVPPGYALQATANAGTAQTFPAPQGQYLTLWLGGGFSIRPPRPLGPGDSLPTATKTFSHEQLQALTAALRAQLQELEDQGPIPVAFGKPKQMFSITNANDSGEVWQGFLGLVRSETNEPSARVNPVTGQPFANIPAAAINSQTLSPEEQAVSIELQRVKYRTAPMPIPPSPTNN
jgi:predicted Ser/Thr protein kinase